MCSSRIVECLSNCFASNLIQIDYVNLWVSYRLYVFIYIIIVIGVEIRETERERDIDIHRERERDRGSLT